MFDVRNSDDFARLVDQVAGGVTEFSQDARTLIIEGLECILTSQEDFSWFMGKLDQRRQAPALLGELDWDRQTQALASGLRALTDAELSHLVRDACALMGFRDALDEEMPDYWTKIVVSRHRQATDEKRPSAEDWLAGIEQRSQATTAEGEPREDNSLVTPEAVPVTLAGCLDLGPDDQLSLMWQFVPGGSRNVTHPLDAFLDEILRELHARLDWTRRREQLRWQNERLLAEDICRALLDAEIEMPFPPRLVAARLINEDVRQWLDEEDENG